MITMKTVNIKAMTPIKNVTPPIYGIKNGIKMELNDILKCLCKRAIIDEVLSDGSLIRLNTKNFREDFEGKLKKASEKKSDASKLSVPGDVPPEESNPEQFLDGDTENHTPEDNDPPEELKEPENTEFVPSADDPSNSAEDATAESDENTYVPEEDKVENKEAPAEPETEESKEQVVETAEKTTNTTKSSSKKTSGKKSSKKK